MDLFIRPATEEVLKVTNSTSKAIYGALIGSNKPRISAQQKWALTYPELDRNQGESSWKDRYQAPYGATRDTKYQAFQYKVLLRIIPCNKYLANIRIKQENTCAYCEEVDSIQHFLFECDNTKRFWSQICRWLGQNADLVIQVSQQEFLLGVHPSIPDARKINFITIFTKFFVHRQKLFHNGDLSLVLFLRELRSKLRVEKQICSLEGKPDKFKGWNCVLTALG